MAQEAPADWSRRPLAPVVGDITPVPRPCTWEGPLRQPLPSEPRWTGSTVPGRERVAPARPPARRPPMSTGCRRSGRGRLPNGARHRRPRAHRVREGSVCRSLDGQGRRSGHDPVGLHGRLPPARDCQLTRGSPRCPRHVEENRPPREIEPLQQSVEAQKSRPPQVQVLCRPQLKEPGGESLVEAGCHGFRRTRQKRPGDAPGHRDVHRSGPTAGDPCARPQPSAGPPGFPPRPT